MSSQEQSLSDAVEKLEPLDPLDFVSLPKQVMFRDACYDLLRSLGQGGMGKVGLYTKRDAQASGHPCLVLKTTCCPKPPKKDVDRCDRLRIGKRVIAEAFANRLVHRNKERLYACCLGKLQYIVMPWIQGCLLSEVKPLSVDAVVHIGYKLACHLHAMQMENVFHGDMKADNVILTNDGDAIPIDFGLSEVADRPGWRPKTPGKISGTYLYMSPEKWVEDKPMDGKADVYALAHTLYEAVQGSPLITVYTHMHVIELANRHKYGLDQRKKSQWSGGFTDALNAMEDQQFRAILEPMLISKRYNRNGMSRAKDSLLQECLRRQIDPDAPLYATIKLPLNADMEPKYVLKALNEAARTEEKNLQGPNLFDSFDDGRIF